MLEKGGGCTFVARPCLRTFGQKKGKRRGVSGKGALSGPHKTSDLIGPSGKRNVSREGAGAGFQCLRRTAEGSAATLLERGPSQCGGIHRGPEKTGRSAAFPIPGAGGRGGEPTPSAKTTKQLEKTKKKYWCRGVRDGAHPKPVEEKEGEAFRQKRTIGCPGNDAKQLNSRKKKGRPSPKT